MREFLDEAFGYLNMDWHEVVKIDPRYFRPNEVDYLQADPIKARRVLDWEPRVYFKDLVRIMVDADLELIGLESPGKGAKIIEKHHGNWHRWDSQVVSVD
jgi:GDPmannose 4,6-dehydratase